MFMWLALTEVWSIYTSPTLETMAGWHQCLLTKNIDLSGTAHLKKCQRDTAYPLFCNGWCCWQETRFGWVISNLASGSKVNVITVAVALLRLGCISFPTRCFSTLLRIFSRGLSLALRLTNTMLRCYLNDSSKRYSESQVPYWKNWWVSWLTYSQRTSADRRY